MYRPILSLLLITGCVKSPAALKVDPAAPPPDLDAVVYALPRTVFVAQGTITRVTREQPKHAYCLDPKINPDDLQVLARKLGYPDLAQAQKANLPGTTFGVSDVKLTARSEPDPEAIFALEYPRALLADTNLKVTLGADGVFSSMDATVTDKVAPAVGKTVEVAASILSGSLGWGAANATPEALLAEKLKVCIDLDKKLDKISRDRDTLYHPITPLPKDTLELLLAKTTVDLEEVRAAYFGEAEITKGSFACEVAPTTAAPVDLFWLHKATGIEPRGTAMCTQSAGFSVTTPTAGTLPSSAKAMTLTVQGAAPTLTSIAKQAADAEDPGFYYRVPGVAYVGLTGIPKAEVAPTRFVVGQFGVVATLPRARLTGSAHFAVELHPDSGALKSVQVERKAADVASLIGSAGTASTTILTAIQPDDDPLTQLQYDQAVLEATIAIHDAQATIDSW